MMVLSETLLKRSITDNTISLDDYEIYRTDHAVYVKSKFRSSGTLSFTKANLCVGSCDQVLHILSASKDALKSISVE